MADPLVEVSDLRIHYEAGKRLFGKSDKVIRAVDGISFEIYPGETLGLVGESGSGKTTTGRALLRQVDVTTGTIRFKDRDITHVKGEPLRALRREMQLVFQDPYASLNPRLRVMDLIGEALVVHPPKRSKVDIERRVYDLLSLVGLPPDAAHSYPHAFSGGQRQRIGIARALALEPEFIVADEPVSALDVSIRAQIVNLMAELQEKLGLTYLFIAHDLGLIGHVSHRVAIMYAGEIVEMGDCAAIYNDPRHPYTRALLSAAPVLDPEEQKKRQRIVIKGEIPDPSNPPSGCRFHTRCQMAEARCSTEAPPLERKTHGQLASCWFT